MLPIKRCLAAGTGLLDLGGLTLTMLGDLKHGRTVHSLALLAARVAVPPRLAFCAPASLGMPDEVTAALTEKGVAFDTHDSLAAALPSNVSAQSGGPQSNLVFKEVWSEEAQLLLHIKGAAAGLGGIMIEDQVAPKRCGHTRDKMVVDRETLTYDPSIFGGDLGPADAKQC